MIPGCVTVRQDDPAITIVTLNRPEKRNALNVGLIESLRDSVLAASADRNQRVLILRGAGPVFCAGLDLNEAADPAQHDRSARALAAMYEAISLSPLLTIASAQGAAMGGGAGLLAACDFVVATEDLRLGYPEVRRGLVAALVTCLLRRQLNDRAVRDLILLGRTISATEAQTIGLANRVVPANLLAHATGELAREACCGAPGAIARTKRLLDDLAPRPIHEDLERALVHHLAARESQEAAEGTAAFREKREPRWKSRPEERNES